ncbi:radical SAM protein [candidate division KSB1 bacterium]|nr:radical SAM protein [candidate division KSB1 bacterium]RQW07657.1 MAG: radical SAM protein [candidate division KSB1 bacterium]
MKKLWDKIGPGVAREVAINRVLASLTARRVWNAFVNALSFVISAVTHKTVVWGYPPIVNIEPTNMCNLRCPLCVTGSGMMKRPPGRLDVSQFRQVVDQVADKIIYLTLYHQGEPYLHSQFNDMVAYAKSKGLYVTTSTNGHFFTPEMADRVVQSKLDSMIISLDGATQETYAHYRVRGQLDTVLQGIRNLVDAKKRAATQVPYLFLQFLVMKQNEHELAAVKQLARELGVDRLLIKTAQVLTLDEAKAWLPLNEKYRRYQLTKDAFEVKRGRGACPRLWMTTLIDWDGQIVPCCFDKNGDYAMGRLASGERFAEIWKDKKYNNFRRRMLRDRNSIEMCRNCNYGVGLFK